MNSADNGEFSQVVFFSGESLWAAAKIRITSQTFYVGFLQNQAEVLALKVRRFSREWSKTFRFVKNHTSIKYRPIASISSLSSSWMT